MRENVPAHINLGLDIQGGMRPAYEVEVDNMVTGLTSLLEPLLILMMGGIVAFVALAILLPMFVVDFLSYMWSGLHEVRWASLFHYVPSMPGADTVDFRLGVAVLWTVGALTSLAAFARWQRQDL